MALSRRNFFKAALAAPIGASFVHYNAVAAPAAQQIKITAIKIIQLSTGARLVKIETDAGIVGYGPTGTSAGGPSGNFAESLVQGIATGGEQSSDLGLVGKDPLSIELHFHHMFYSWAQRENTIRLCSGIDIALWDLAGKILNQPVSKLLGGNFRDKLKLYSHCPHQGNFMNREEWRHRAQLLKDDPRGFTAYKVDINDPLGVTVSQDLTTLSPGKIRDVKLCYELARESFGDEIDVIVHCHNELDTASAIKVAEAVEGIKPLFFEDPLDYHFSEKWMALRRSTRITLLTGENMQLMEMAAPFIMNEAVDWLQPDLCWSGGITGVKKIADLAAYYRMPVTMHTAGGGGWAQMMASQQLSAALHNCPYLECGVGGDRAAEAASNLPVIEKGYMNVSTLPGLGLDIKPELLRG